MEKQGVKAFFMIALIFGMFMAHSSANYIECYVACFYGCAPQEGSAIKCAAKCALECIGKKPFAEIIEETSTEDVSKHTEDFCKLGCITSLNKEQNTEKVKRDLDFCSKFCTKN